MSSYRNIFNLWLSYVAGMVCFGWLLSAMDAYRWMGAAALLLACTLAFLFHRSWRGIQPEEKERLKNDLRFPPFLILLLLITLAGSLYTSSVLDSLSYRIPRMLMWLQEGGIHYIDNPDARLNFMTPIWEFASTPLYQAAEFRLLWLGSGISWILLYLAFIFISGKLGADPKTSRWLAMIPSASVGFVLQAASTMNDVWAAAFIAISLVFILAFEEKRNFSDLVSSGLALSLAAGAKPHFAVLALPWLLWLVLSHSRPLAAIRWKWVVPTAFLGLVCSPLPTFISNHIHYGSFKGAAGDGGFGIGPWWMNLLLGTVMMLWQTIQLPINPLAGVINALFQDFAASSGLSEVAPRFKIASAELPIVDNSSIGFVAALAICIGFVVALRHRTSVPKWIKYCLMAGVFGFLVAVSQVVPSTLGRSFVPFVVLVIPTALFGLARLRHGHLKILSIITVGCAFFSIAVSPSHPLWPTKTIAARLPKFEQGFSRYINPQKKPYAGISAVNIVPLDAPEIGIMAVGDHSLIRLWDQRNPSIKVRFLPSQTSTDDLARKGPEWFILIAADPESPDALFGKLAVDLRTDTRFERVFSDQFVAVGARGPEQWLVYRRTMNSLSN
jgi:hypothetical protein